MTNQNVFKKKSLWASSIKKHVCPTFNKTICVPQFCTSLFNRALLDSLVWLRLSAFLDSFVWLSAFLDSLVWLSACLVWLFAFQPALLIIWLSVFHDCLFSYQPILIALFHYQPSLTASFGYQPSLVVWLIPPAFLDSLVCLSAFHGCLFGYQSSLIGYH